MVASTLQMSYGQTTNISLRQVAPVNPQAGSAFSIGYMKGLIERVISEG